MKIKIVLALALMPPLLCISILGNADVTGNPVAGKQKTRMCEGCHGIDGWRTAYPEVYSVPKLGGQHAAYITNALKEYKSGERYHPSMRAIAASLSDQDIADLAAYYSSNSPVAEK